MIYRLYKEDGRPEGAMYIGGYTSPYFDFESKEDAERCLARWQKEHDSYTKEFKKLHWIPDKMTKYIIKELPDTERFIPSRPSNRLALRTSDYRNRS